MNSTKLMKTPNLEYLGSGWMHPRIFDIQRIPRSSLKDPFFNGPFPLKKNHVSYTAKKYDVEEEKVNGQLANKENVSSNNASSINSNNLPGSQKSRLGNFTGTFKFTGWKNDKKCGHLEQAIKNSSQDLYTEERVVLENEYGLPTDDMFRLTQDEAFETQPLAPENFENTHNEARAEEQVPPATNEESEPTCNGLKKGIDNDAIIADISTMDGLSMYEDILEVTQKKAWEDEEYENIDIFLTETYPRSEVNDNVTHFDCGQSKGLDEDFEEEKVQKSVSNKIMGDFWGEDYEMDFESLLIKPQMMEESVPLHRKNSKRDERGLSFFDERSMMLSEEFNLDSNGQGLRNRSLSKITVDEWYWKDWRNSHTPSKFGTHEKLVNGTDLQEEEEPDYFKQFDTILKPETEVVENDFRTICEALKGVDTKLEIVDQEMKDLVDQVSGQIEEYSPAMMTFDSQELNLLTSKDDNSEPLPVPDSGCF